MAEYYRIVGSNSPSFFSASLHWTAKVKGPSGLISGEFLFLFAEGTFLSSFSCDHSFLMWTEPGSLLPMKDTSFICGLS